jgi:methionyl aminopeptidase
LRLRGSAAVVNLRSAREIGLMRRAGLTVWAAHQKAMELVRPGVTTAEINAAVEAFFAERDAVPLFKGVPGKVPFPAACCISVNEEVVHGIPGSRILREGDVVSIDTGCSVGGWCGDAAITHAVGRVEPRVEALLACTQGVLALAIELMAHRNRWSDVAIEMAKYVRDHGFSVVENFVGHGIGRTMHEDPQVPNFCTPAFRRNHDFELEPGLVIAVEPMVNLGSKKVRVLGDHWTQATIDGLPSAHFEHTIAITDGGPVVLTAPPLAGEEFSPAGSAA